MAPGTQPASASSIRVERRDGIAELVIDRPPANALDDRTLDDFRGALEGLVAEAPAGLVITGAGDRFFSVGGDIKELQGLDLESGIGRVDRFNGVMTALMTLHCPVAIAVNGTAVGGGTELLLNCDHSVGVEGSRFGLPEINHGLLPSALSMALAVRRLGPPRASEILLSGDLIDADRAVEIGLLSESVGSATEARRRAREWVATMAAKPPALVAAIKHALRAAPDLDTEELVDLTRAQFRDYFCDPAAGAARLRVLRRWDR